MTLNIRNIIYAASAYTYICLDSIPLHRLVISNPVFCVFRYMYEFVNLRSLNLENQTIGDHSMGK